MNISDMMKLARQIQNRGGDPRQRARVKERAPDHLEKLDANKKKQEEVIGDHKANMTRRLKNFEASRPTLPRHSSVGYLPPHSPSPTKTVKNAEYTIKPLVSDTTSTPKKTPTIPKATPTNITAILNEGVPPSQQPLSQEEDEKYDFLEAP